MLWALLIRQPRNIPAAKMEGGSFSRNPSLEASLYLLGKLWTGNCVLCSWARPYLFSTHSSLPLTSHSVPLLMACKSLIGPRPGQIGQLSEGSESAIIRQFNKSQEQQWRKSPTRFKFKAETITFALYETI